MRDAVVQRSFAAGEISPSLAARADLAKYQAGLRTCRNFLVKRDGGVTYRPGFKFLASAKSDGPTFLFRYVFAAANESYIIEAGDNYFRFYKNGVRVTVSGVAAWSGATAYLVGDLVVSGGVNYYCILAHTNHVPANATYWYPLTGNIYEIPTPYAAGAFEEPGPACFAQSGAVITITHVGHPPRELTRFSATRWTLANVVTAPAIAAPVGGAGVAGGAGARKFRYVVTAVSATYEESNPSAVIEIPTAVQPVKGAPNVLTWTPVAGALEYRVYADAVENNTFGYLGTATGAAAFNDVGETPDLLRTPPIPRVLFGSANEYPAVSVIYQQRRILAGTGNNPEEIFASRVGFRSNFGIRSPLQPDDAVTFTIASNQIHPVHHLVDLKQLVVLTEGGAWVVAGDATGALTPTDINPDQHAYTGASFVEPIVLGNRIVYIQGRGSVLRDLRFDQQVEGLAGKDLSLYSAHLFKGFTLVDMAYQEVPDSIIWCVRSDGALLGLTYIPEEDVWGWHRHDTDGEFEQVCVIPEGDEDAVYAVVKRTIDGNNVFRYIERLTSRQWADVQDAVHVDSAVIAAGPTTVVTGLAHLEGKTVSVFAQGAKVPGAFVVANGGVGLPASKTKIAVGLPIVGDLEALDLDVAGTSVRDKKKRVVGIALILEDSFRGFSLGPDADHLKVDQAAPWQSTGLVSGQVEAVVTGGFTENGRFFLRHTDPTPLTVLGILPNLEVGG